MGETQQRCPVPRTFRPPQTGGGEVFEELWGAWIRRDNRASVCLPGKDNVSQRSTYACIASHLQGRRDQHTHTHTHTQTPSVSQKIPFSGVHNTVVSDLMCSHCVTAASFPFGSGSYSNPFLHASNRLILSLLSCCSTWRRIMPGTHHPPVLPFGSYIMYTFFFFYRNP